MEEEEGEALSARHSVEILINEDKKAQSLLKKFDFAHLHKFIAENGNRRISETEVITPGQSS